MIVGNPSLFNGGAAPEVLIGDPDFASVKLLLHFEGTNGSTTITDSSGIPKTVTSVNGAALSTASSAFGNSSVDFNGTTKYLRVPHDAALDVGTNQDFCIEAMICPRAGTGIWFSRQAQSGLAIQFYVYTVDGFVRFGALFRTLGDSTVYYWNTTYNITLNTYNHCVVDRLNGYIRLFVNGIKQYEVYYPHALTSPSFVADISFGALAISGWSPSQFYNGNVDEFRFSSVSRYATDFTPPTAPFLDYAPTIPLPAILANVSLLCNFTNDGSDATGKQATLYGTPTFSDGQMILTSAGHHLTFADHTDFDYGSGNLTIEFFATIATGGVGSDNYLTLMCQMPTNAGTANILYIYFESRAAGNNRGWTCKWFTSGWVPVVVLEEANNASANYLDNVEYHIAIVCNETSFKLYCNGVEKASTTYASALPNPTGVLRIGGDGTAASNWRGSISAVRISREALYTAPFTPPTLPFPEA